MTATLEAVKRPPARELARDCELTDAAHDLLVGDIKGPQFLAALAREGLWMDAVGFAPFCLPRTDAVWWASLCLWQYYRPAPSPEVDACLKAVVTWLQDPSDANRRAAYDAGQIAKPATPAGNLALGVFMSGGSISVAGQPEVPTKPKYLPQSLATAVKLAIRKSPTHLVAARQNDFVRLALEVLTGRWPLPQPAAK